MSKSSQPKIQLKQPKNCTKSELHGLATLILEGGEVAAANLEERINSAEYLVFLTNQSQLVAVASLKNPDLNYKLNVFKKAESKLDPADFQFELGWIYVHPSARGQGLSHLLVQAALSASKGKLVFATSRADNLQIHGVLSKYGFVQSGSEYHSSRGKYNLVLLVQS